MERRAAGLTDEELEILADRITAKMPRSEGCRLTEEQQQAVVELITAKRKVVKWSLWLIGLMVVWVLKDVYHFIITHLGWVK